MSKKSPSEWEADLRKVLESIGECSNQDERVKNAVISNDTFTLDDNCIINETFRYVLLCYAGYSCYLQSLRSLNPENVGKQDWELLQKVEVLTFPKKEWVDGWTVEIIRLYLSAIKKHISSKLPLCTILRSVSGSSSEWETPNRMLTECDEIIINLLRDYIQREYLISKELHNQVVENSKTNGLEYITEAVPTFNEMFSTVGNSCYLKIYTYLPEPESLKDDVPGHSNMPLNKYLRPIVQEIINIPVSDRSSLPIMTTRYGKINTEAASLIRRELTRVLIRVPFIIEGFWEQCTLLPMAIMFSFPRQDMAERVMAETNCSIQEANSLLERLALVIGKYKRVGIDWETVSRVDLMGLNLLLQKGLVTVISRSLPTLDQLSTLTSIIVSGRKIKGIEETSEAHWILSLIIQNMYEELNVASFKAKLNLMASLVSCRVALENSWDFHTYLLRKSMYERSKSLSPTFTDHAVLIKKFNTELQSEESSNCSSTNCSSSSSSRADKSDKIGDPEDSKLQKDCDLPTMEAVTIKEKIKMIESDMKKSIIVLIVIMEIENKLRYISKTYEGQVVQLLRHTDSHLDVQGMDLRNPLSAQSLHEKLMSFHRAFPKSLHGCRVSHSFCLITTTSFAGSVLAISIQKLEANRQCQVFTLPERILTFYDQDFKLTIGADELLEHAWNCFTTNTGHLSYHLSKIRIQQEAKKYQEQEKHDHSYPTLQPLTDWEYQASLKNSVKPLDVLFVLLHVAVANNRISVQRCLSDPFYAQSIQFLLQCSDERMKQIAKTIEAVRPHLTDHKQARECLLERFSKSEVLQFLGLCSEEIEHYSHLFYWEECYLLDKNLASRALFFNALVSETDKYQLYVHLEKKNEDITKGVQSVIPTLKYYENRFIWDIIQKDDWSCVTSFDRNMEHRVKNPDDFFFEGRGDVWFVRFGSQVEEIFQNVDLFSFKCVDAMKFCIQHLPIGLYLKPLVACFPNDFPEDVIMEVDSIDTSNEPTKVAKAQALVLCALNKHEGLVLPPDTKKDYIVTPIFTKKINSIIINLKPPSDAHRYDLLTTLINLTYLDNGGYERIAGRCVLVNEFKKHHKITEHEFDTFQNTELEDTKKKFSVLAKNRIYSHENVTDVINSTKLPNLDKHFMIDKNVSVRLKLIPSKFYGGFPFHLEVENPVKQYKMI